MIFYKVPKLRKSRSQLNRFFVKLKTNVTQVYYNDSLFFFYSILFFSYQLAILEARTSANERDSLRERLRVNSNVFQIFKISLSLSFRSLQTVPWVNVLDTNNESKILKLISAR